MEGGDDVGYGSGCGGRSMVGLGEEVMSIDVPFISFSRSDEVDWLSSMLSEITYVVFLFEKDSCWKDPAVRRRTSVADTDLMMYQAMID